MTKEQIIAEFTAKGEFNTYSHSFNATWDHAFKLYTAATGDKVNPKCGSCYSRVLKWLKPS